MLSQLPIAALAKQPCLQADDNVNTNLTDIDSLSGLYNKYFFEASYHQLMNNKNDIKSDLSIVIVEIDDFETFNRHYGQKRGDICLKLISQLCVEALYQPSDFAARYTGEQFVLVLPNTNIEIAKHTASNLIQQVNRLAMPHSESLYGRVTINVGVSSRATSSIGEDIVSLAIKRLNLIKQACYKICA